jgi:hypothetical protein
MRLLFALLNQTLEGQLNYGWRLLAAMTAHCALADLKSAGRAPLAEPSLLDQFSDPIWCGHMSSDYAASCLISIVIARHHPGLP